MGPSAADVVAGIGLMFFAALVLSVGLTPLVRNLATRRGWLDRPDGTRKTHSVPVPRLGGVAVYLSVLLSCGLAVLLLREAAGPVAIGAYLHLVTAGTAVLLVGLADDVFGVSPSTKILVQAAAGLYLYYNGYQIRVLSNPFFGDTLTLGFLSLPITLIWFVGMSNAFNLIDGVDGLAAGIGLFSSVTVFVAALINQSWEIALLAVALAGALLGFLRYNFHPASIFLGDSGSLFVGFALAGVAVRGSMKSSTAIAVAAPLLALGLPIIDTLMAMARRLLSGKRIFEADAEHIHHRMLRKGLTPRRVVIILYGVAALFGALSLLTMANQSQVLGLVVIVFSVVTWVGIRQLGYSEFGEIQRILKRNLFPSRWAAPGATDLNDLRRRFHEARDMGGLWNALSQAAPDLGLCRLELGLADASQTEGAARVWQAPETEDHSMGTWSCRIPLVSDGRLLGDLTIWGCVPREPARFGMFDFLEAIGRDFVGALTRLGDPPPGRRDEGRPAEARREGGAGPVVAAAGEVREP